MQWCICMRVLRDFRQFWGERFWRQFRLWGWHGRVCGRTRSLFASTALSAPVLWHYCQHVSHASLSRLRRSTAVWPACVLSSVVAIFGSGTDPIPLLILLFFSCWGDLFLGLIFWYDFIHSRYNSNKPVGARFARSYLYATSMFSCFHA